MMLMTHIIVDVMGGHKMIDILSSTFILMFVYGFVILSFKRPNKKLYRVVMRLFGIVLFLYGLFLLTEVNIGGR